MNNLTTRVKSESSAHASDINISYYSKLVKITLLTWHFWSKFAIFRYNAQNTEQFISADSPLYHIPCTVVEMVYVIYIWRLDYMYLWFDLKTSRSACASIDQMLESTINHFSERTKGTLSTNTQVLDPTLTCLAQTDTDSHRQTDRQFVYEDTHSHVLFVQV